MSVNKSQQNHLWQSESGADLLDLYNGAEPLATLLPKCAAVYMWKLALAPGILQKADPDEYTTWLDRLCTIPLGRVADSQLSHYLRLSNVEIRGRGLPEPKKQFFRKFLSPNSARKWMTEYINELSAHLPALYVGETENLQQRITQHLSGESQFGAQVREAPELSWKMLRLYFVRIENRDSEFATAARRSLEYLTSSLTIAGFTIRPG
ncbi:GIY-YIG nuclease family protein [Mycobacterium sp. 1245801.1]|uniref:GIY-YIG nuclease family protein n=1 Tax=Mycobacterium sp. 1245801.1 TaxID=1834075 RepID=UPI000B0B5292|nr:GIY-YIG nuclease family protein [Mycobacterium sp. 1245801.1]